MQASQCTMNMMHSTQTTRATARTTMYKKHKTCRQTALRIACLVLTPPLQRRHAATAVLFYDTPSTCLCTHPGAPPHRASRPRVRHSRDVSQRRRSRTACSGSLSCRTNVRFRAALMCACCSPVRFAKLSSRTCPPPPVKIEVTSGRVTCHTVRHKQQERGGRKRLTLICFVLINFNLRKPIRVDASPCYGGFQTRNEWRTSGTKKACESERVAEPHNEWLGIYNHSR